MERQDHEDSVGTEAAAFPVVQEQPQGASPVGEVLCSRLRGSRWTSHAPGPWEIIPGRSQVKEMDKMGMVNALKPSRISEC